MILPKGGGIPISAFIACFFFSFGVDLTTAEVCTYSPPDCTEPDCLQETECLHGTCDDLGQCRCLSCYTGETCSEYNDVNGPRFPVPTDTIVINPNHEGKMYRAIAADNDLDETCDDGQDEGTECPCAKIFYSIRYSDISDTFVIDENSGELFLDGEGILESGEEYQLTLVASSVSSSSTEGHPVLEDAQTLIIVVHEPNPLKDDLGLLKSFPEAVPLNNDKIIVDNGVPNESLNSEELRKSDSNLQAHIRKKRDSAGADGDSGASILTLTELTSSVPATLKPGNSIDYQLTVILPTLTTAIDLDIEIFVMDAVSGVSPFAICSPKIVSIGSQIKDQDGNAFDIPTLNSAVEMKINDQFQSFYDRAVFDFGQVTNGDVVGDGTTNTADSTITITFTAALIKNTQYTNDTVIVTAGAEYDSEKYVWVSQASYNFDMAPPETYLQTISLSGPDTLAEWTGGTYTINAIITNPFDQMTIEVYSLNDRHDLFSVFNLAINSKGANWGCQIDKDTLIRYDSVTGRSVHRIVIQSFLLLTNLDYTNMGPASADAGNKIDISFGIFLMDAVEGEIVSFGAGILIGTDTIWTGAINVTVTAGSLTPAGGDPSAWAMETVANTAVDEFGTATFGAKATIPDGANALIDCTITGSADNQVCAVVYGAIGSNIAYAPDLTQLVTYTDDGSASFQVNINSTGAGNNDIVFEVSVHYLTTTIGDVSLSCSGGLAETLTATTGVKGILDMTGVAGSLTTDTSWYDGSQAGLLIKLTFPVNSAPYGDLIMEAAGDLEISGWGAKVCKAEVVSAGRGVPCIAGQKKIINDGFLTQKSKDNSIFDDGAKLQIGSACGTDRLTSSPSDFEVFLRVIYEIPPAQPTAAAGTFNMSVGVSLDENLIWTGWDNFNFDTASPARDANTVPKFTTLTPATNAIDVGIPQLIEVTLKTFPGSVGTYKILATAVDPTLLSICRIIFLGVGSNYGCIDENPYGKEIEPFQVTTIIHDATDWGASATLDLGTLRNLGQGDIYSDDIADEDSIYLGIFIKGLAAGTSNLNVQLDYSGTLEAPISLEYVTSTVAPNTGTLTVVAEGLDGTDDAYEGVMKQVNFKFTVPKDYAQVVTMKITSTQVADISLCFGAVFTAGKNIPCVIPSQTISNKTHTDVEDVVEINLLQVCYYSMSEDPAESEIIVRVGAMFLEGSAGSATITAVVTEGTTEMAPITYTMNKASGDYDPGNFSTEGMKLELLDNTTTTVYPGLRMKTAVALTIPKFTTFPIELGIMTPSDAGRAYVTVHGFSFREGGSKNLGCLLSDCQLYNPIIIQNSSFDIPMIHDSQTDTVVVNLKYVTNTGLSHVHLLPKPEDDQIWLEADLLIADHTNATTTGDIFTISFALKVGNLIFVIEKELVLAHDSAAVPKIGTEIYLTDESTTVFTALQQISMTARMYHEMNVSQEEANSAIMRIYLPKYLSFVNDSAVAPVDSWNPNITGNLTVKNYIDYDIGHLFFTDILEVNFTLTVDPLEQLPKGLGLVNATTLLRLVCNTNNIATLRYCGNTSYVMYQINASDCEDSLNVDAMQDCQFSASTAIDASVAPAQAKPVNGAGWKPAVRTGDDWIHHITIDFLKKTRVTKIELKPVSSSRLVTKVKIQYSHSGQSFLDACPNELIFSGTILSLPKECRFEARYARMLILEASGDAEASPIGVRFDWFGCPIETVDDTCNAAMKTTLTDTTIDWRHVAYDSVNGIYYFCDFMPKKKRVSCYSSTDASTGSVWQALPSYVGRLIGFDGAKMYAKDRKDQAMISSVDGINWSIVDSSTSAAVETAIAGTADGPATPIPGDVETSIDVVELGPWTADYFGVSFNGAYKSKWASCCS